MLPRYLTNGLNSFDKTVRKYLLAPDVYVFREITYPTVTLSYLASAIIVWFTTSSSYEFITIFFDH